MKLHQFFLTVIVVNVLSIFGAKCQPVSADVLADYAGWPRFAEIARFYQQNKGQFAWIGYKSRQQDLLSLLSEASSVGLDGKDYQGVFLGLYQPGTNHRTFADSVETDLRFTDAAIHFFSALKGGNSAPSFGYNGLRYSPDLSGVVPALKTTLESGRLQQLFLAVQPSSGEYIHALAKLRWFRRIAEQKDFSEPRIQSTVADSSNQALLVRLYQLGVTDSIDPVVSKKELQIQIRKAQAGFDLAVDGVLGKATLQALNTSLQQRIEEVKAGLNLLRWLSDSKQSANVLILNIPSANFYVYEKGEIVLESKIIAGKPSTPTPTLTSIITEVILYPYWNVTHNIATKEMLPHIKRDIGYLERGNYQVLNRQGKVLNPSSINWHSLSPGNFPYLIRQSTGCDNALGIVKFNFYNPFTVYLHDTPTKTLFASQRRFYSHGCMRVEKPVELARYLLGFNRIAIDTLTAKGCLASQAPKTVKVQPSLPVMIVYSTMWYNREGEIRFYEDVYKRQVRAMPPSAAGLLRTIAGGSVPVAGAPYFP